MRHSLARSFPSHLCSFLCLFGASTMSLLAQPGLGSKIWEEAKAQFSAHDHYEVDFVLEQNSPISRNKPLKGHMIYSAGKFVVSMPQTTWYFNGDTLWEYQREPREWMERKGLDPVALYPAEMLHVLTRQPLSVRHFGKMEQAGVSCDKLKLDMSGRSLPYETAFLWTTPQREVMKVIFLDQWQISTTVLLERVSRIPKPSEEQLRKPRESRFRGAVPKD